MTGHNPEAIRIILDCRIEKRTTIEGEHYAYYGMLRAGSELPVVAMPYSNPRRHVQVRRFVFERKVRPLEDNEFVHATCDHPRCIRPEHLVALTRRRVMT